MGTRPEVTDLGMDIMVQGAAMGVKFVAQARGRDGNLLEIRDGGAEKGDLVEDRVVGRVEAAGSGMGEASQGVEG